MYNHKQLIIIRKVEKCNQKDGKNRDGNTTGCKTCDGDTGGGRTRGVVRGRLRPGSAPGADPGGLGCDHQCTAGANAGPLWGPGDPHGDSARYGYGPHLRAGGGDHHLSPGWGLPGPQTAGAGNLYLLAGGGPEPPGFYGERHGYEPTRRVPGPLWRCGGLENGNPAVRGGAGTAVP